MQQMLHTYKNRKHFSKLVQNVYNLHFEEILVAPEDVEVLENRGRKL